MAASRLIVPAVCERRDLAARLNGEELSVCDGKVRNVLVGTPLLEQRELDHVGVVADREPVEL